MRLHGAIELAALEARSRRPSRGSGRCGCRSRSARLRTAASCSSVPATVPAAVVDRPRPAPRRDRRGFRNDARRLARPGDSPSRVESCRAASRRAARARGAGRPTWHDRRHDVAAVNRRRSTRSCVKPSTVCCSAITLRAACGSRGACRCGAARRRARVRPPAAARGRATCGRQPALVELLGAVALFEVLAHFLDEERRDRIAVRGGRS